MLSSPRSAMLVVLLPSLIAACAAPPPRKEGSTAASATTRPASVAPTHSSGARALPTATGRINGHVTRRPTGTATSEGVRPDLPAVAARLVYGGPRADFYDWSPDSRHLAYVAFTAEQAESGYFHGAAIGTFTLFDTDSGAACQRYSLDGRYGHEGPSASPAYVWLPDGDLLIAPVATGSLTATNWHPGSERVLRAAEPCGIEEDVTDHFGEPIVEFLGFNPTEDRLLVRGVDHYSIYDFSNGRSTMIEEPAAEQYQNVRWSPDGRHLGLLPLTPMEAGGSTSRGLGIIAADSGALVAALDFEVYQYLDGPGGGPVWLNAREALVTQISGGAPTIVGVDGSVTSALDRFRMSQFVAAAEDPGLPQGVEVDAHLSAAGDRFHVVTSSPVEAATGNPVILIYHSELDEVEQLPASATGGAFMRPDGTVELYDTSDDASRLLRNVDPPGAPAIEGPKNACARRRWYASVSPPDERPYVAETRTEDTVAIYRWPDCATPVRTVRIAGLQDERIGSVTVSPDGRQLAISVGHTYPWRALYIAEVDAGGQ